MNMKRINLILLFGLIFIVAATSLGYGANLHLEPEVYKLQITNFTPHSSYDDFLNFSLGYGRNYHQGYEAKVISGEGRTIVEAEYQFLPENIRERARGGNYAFKIGAVSGNHWNQDDPGGKVGIILDRVLDRDREIYFSGDLIVGDTASAALEFGGRGKLAPDIFGVLGYKIVANAEEDKDDITGVTYGLKTEF